MTTPQIAYTVQTQQEASSLLALLNAVQLDQFDFAIQLLDAGVDIDSSLQNAAQVSSENPLYIRDFIGYTPLMIAARRGAVKMIRLLVARGANVDIWKTDLSAVANPSPRDGSCTALFIAAERGMHEAVGELLNHNAQAMYDFGNARWSVLHALVQIPDHLFGEHHEVTARQIIQRNAVHVDSVAVFFGAGCTPLEYAASGGRLKLTQVLTRFGVRLDGTPSILLVEPLRPQDVHDTPLIRAIRGSHTDVARHLVRSGANANITDGLGLTPLHWCCSVFQPQSLELLKDLVEVTMEINKASRDGSTPLLLLFASWRNRASRKHLEAEFAAADYMLERAANINTARNDGKTIVHVAITAPTLQPAQSGASSSARSSTETDDIVMIKYLLSKGLRQDALRALDAQGQTPLDIARTSQNPATSDYLRSLVGRG